MVYWQIRCPDSELMHYGVKGMKWGVRRTPEQLGHKKVSTAKSLSKKMQKEIKYAQYSGLKSHDQVAKTKSGDCHSQVMYEMKELKDLNPKAEFFMEINPKTGQGGVTHSFVYFENGGKTYWFENSWEGHSGVHEFSSKEEMLKQVKKDHLNEQTSERKQYSQIEFAPFIPEKHKPGESLQDLVNIVFEEDDK